MLIAHGLSRLSLNIHLQCSRAFRRMSVGRLVGRLSRLRNLSFCSVNNRSFRMKDTVFHDMVFHGMNTSFHENLLCMSLQTW